MGKTTETPDDAFSQEELELMEKYPDPKNGPMYYFNVVNDHGPNNVFMSRCYKDIYEVAIFAADVMKRGNLVVNGYEAPLLKCVIERALYNPETETSIWHTIWEKEVA